MDADLISPDRLPPQSREAEKGVIGSVLRDNAVLSDILNVIRPDNFYFDAHQKIFQAVIDLYNDGKPVDTVILFETLRQRKQLEDVGGAEYLADLWDAAPTAANAEYYARIVRDKAVVRNLIHASTELLRDAYDGVTSADELLGMAERKVLEIAEKGTTGETHDLKDTLTEAFNRIDQRAGTSHLNISGIGSGFVDLDNITAGLQNNELVIVAARPSVGKCLTEDSEILLVDGRIETIGELVRRRSGRLLTLHNDWKLRPTSPSAYVDDGVKPVYRVRTRLGRVIETTASHPFRTLGGWRPLAELRPGDRIAVPRRLPVFGKVPMRDCEVKLLAYLIGDGGLTDTTPEFTNANPRLRAEFTAAVREFGGVNPLPPSPLGGEGRGGGYRRQRLHDIIYDPCGSPPTLTLPPRGGGNKAAPIQVVAEEDATRNPLTLWLDGLGLWGKPARGKFVPAPVFTLPRRQLALFLNRLFATDGWATVLSEGQTQIGFASVSERLARQVQHLLLRFGVIASLRARQVKYRGTRRPAWQLDVTEPLSVRTLGREIGMFGKEAAVTRVLDGLSRKRLKACRDTVPPEVWGLIDRARGGESWASVARRAGLSDRTNLHVGRRGLSRGRLRKLAAAVGCDPLRQLADSDVYWDRIVSVEPAGEKQVYDLTIPTTHNFVANDICVHNTAFALNVVRHVITEERRPVFFVSLEQSRVELAERLLCCQARVDSHKLRKGHLNSDDMHKLMMAGDQLRGNAKEGFVKLFIDDTPARNMLQIGANARRLKLRHDIKL
ncbi:MAG TPA: DnaB-like helicase N-terminal domain-containing protein, partial [Fimbriiglobus sp.]|nr:DnaB-like helicase N-terminal domain-containing protein [Fimbriiglobus sp.]